MERSPLSGMMDSERYPTVHAFTSSSSTGATSIFNSAPVPPPAAPATASVEQDNKDNKRASPQVRILGALVVSHSLGVSRSVQQLRAAKDHVPLPSAEWTPPPSCNRFFLELVSAFHLPF